MKPPCLEKIGLPAAVTQQLHKIPSICVGNPSVLSRKNAAGGQKGHE